MDWEILRELRRLRQAWERVYLGEIAPNPIDWFREWMNKLVFFSRWSSAILDIG